MTIIRAPEPGLLHIFHPAECFSASDSYNSQVTSPVPTENLQEKTSIFQNISTLITSIQQDKMCLGSQLQTFAREDTLFKYLETILIP